jgi:hypothetical protein
MSTILYTPAFSVMPRGISKSTPSNSQIDASSASPPILENASLNV